MNNADAMARDWGHAIVVDPRELHQLRTENAKIRATRDRLRFALPFLLGAIAFTTAAASWQSSRVGRLSTELRDAHRQVARSSNALSTLARSHENMLAATQAAPSMGTKSWGKRFTVTMYVPRSEKYGADNDGLTATLSGKDLQVRFEVRRSRCKPGGEEFRSLKRSFHTPADLEKEPAKTARRVLRQ